MNEQRSTTRVQTVVVGGGQAGLSVGYYLARRKVPFVILDANERVGDAWRQRWDSLRLFTPARYAKLPGSRFPGPGSALPNKDQTADYLEAYAKRWALPMRVGVRVESLERRGEGFVLTAGGERFECESVVVAMSNYQAPRTPEFAKQLAPGIVQMHSHEYRNPAQLRSGGVLVVGAGNSGGEIALELSRTHPTWLAGKESGHIPLRIDAALTRHVLVRLVRFFGHHVLTVDTPIGRKLRPRLLHQAAPLVRVKPQDLLDAGVKRVARVAGVRDGMPALANGQVLDVANVIWCTGYDHGFSWIHLPGFGADLEPLHERGVSHEYPGLYFVGLHFLYAQTSSTLLGVGRDAQRIAKAVAARYRAAQAAERGGESLAGASQRVPGLTRVA